MFRRLFAALVLAGLMAVPVFAAPPARSVGPRAMASDRLLADRIGERIKDYVLKAREAFGSFSVDNKLMLDREVVNSH